MKTVKDETVAEVNTRIRREAAERKRPEVRRIELDTRGRLFEPVRNRVGDAVRQGDLYFHRVGAEHAHGGAVKSRQLARGVTTGSRHMAATGSRVFEGTTLPSYCDARTLLGPFVESGRRVKITHPEHAWLDLPPGRYQVTYQRDERTGAAVQD